MTAEEDLAASRPRQDREPQPTFGDLNVSLGVALAPPGNEVNFSFFYGELAPHGHWHQVEPYGYVWAPAVAADWRPYCDHGHWTYTDQGWYWYSDYSWGWIPFHYGRWHYHPTHHWVWVPGTEWGPAWVTWRASDTYYGWAPLPPEAEFEAGVGISYRGERVGVDFHFGLAANHFAFVPATSFVAADLHSHVVPAARVGPVFNQTTIVKNTYIYQDNRIINRGVPVEQVEQQTQRDIERLEITSIEASSDQALEAAEVRQGNRLAVFRPQVKEEAPQKPEEAAQNRRTRVQKLLKEGKVKKVEGADQKKARAERLQQEHSQQAKEQTEGKASPEAREDGSQKEKKEQPKASPQEREAQETERKEEERDAAPGKAKPDQEAAPSPQQRQEDARQRLERERQERQRKGAEGAKPGEEGNESKAERSQQQRQQDARQRLERERQERQRKGAEGTKPKDAQQKAAPAEQRQEEMQRRLEHERQERERQGTSGQAKPQERGAQPKAAPGPRGPEPGQPKPEPVEKDEDTENEKGKGKGGRER